MKKSNNKKFRLVLTVGVCALFIVTTFSNVIGKPSSNGDFVAEEKESEEIPPNPPNPKPRQLFNFRILNRDWDYWTNPPHLFSIPEGSVGIGVDNPEEKLDVNGTIRTSGFKMPTDASEGYILTCDGSGVGTWQAATGGIGGSGTTNYIPKFTGPTTIGDSVISENNSNIGIGEVPPDDAKLYVKTDPGDWKYSIYAEGQKGIKGVSTALAGTGITGEGGHAGVAGNGGYIGILGQGFYGGWFEGTGYFSGNVGIGTINPEAKLEVSNDSVVSICFEGFEVAYTPEIYPVMDLLFREKNTGKMWDTYMRGGSNSPTPNELGFTFFNNTLGDNDTGNPENWGPHVMSLTPDGNVGIGTTSPSEKLEVSGHIRATPIVGKWKQTSTRIGSGYFIWDEQMLNTNTDYLGWTASSQDITIKKAGYYQINVNVLYSNAEAAKIYIRRNDESIGGNYAQGNGGFCSAAVTIVEYFSAYDTVSIYNPDSGNDRYGSSFPWSTLSIVKLN